MAVNTRKASFGFIPSSVSFSQVLCNLSLMADFLFTFLYPLPRLLAPKLPTCLPPKRCFLKPSFSSLSHPSDPQINHCLHGIFPSVSADTLTAPAGCCWKSHSSPISLLELLEVDSAASCHPSLLFCSFGSFSPLLLVNSWFGRNIQYLGRCCRMHSLSPALWLTLRRICSCPLPAVLPFPLCLA